MSSVIGIDLGTTYCCAAIYEDGEVQIIETQEGSNTTPSHVAFEDDGTVWAGSPAKGNLYLNPANCLYDIKRLIGRKYNDPAVQVDKKLWPFKVVDDGKNSPVIKLTNGKTFYPEQISAKLLSYLKVQAEIFLSKRITKAVITVPVYFNGGQRQATKDAAEIAGLEVLRIINEPTAAAIAYYHQNKRLNGKTILIFDLGGGTFDVSILKINGSKLKELGVGEDPHLGEEDFDNALVDYCLHEFKKKEGVDLKENLYSEDNAKRTNAKNKILRLKRECESTRIALSTARKRAVSLEAMFQDLNLHVEITREKFESLIRPYIDRCFTILAKVIKDTSLSVKQIDEVVLVGGSTNIPAIRTRVMEFFGGKKPHRNIKGSEAVAYGAAILANIVSPKKDPALRMWINDVRLLPIDTNSLLPVYEGYHAYEAQRLDQLKDTIKDILRQHGQVWDEEVEQELHGWLRRRFPESSLIELLAEGLTPKDNGPNVRLTRAQIARMRIEEIISARCFELY